MYDNRSTERQNTQRDIKTDRHNTQKERGRETESTERETRIKTDKNIWLQTDRKTKK